MKFSTIHKLAIFAAMLALQMSAAKTLTTLSDAEADAIIAQQALDKAAREARHLANTFAFEILERREVNLGNRKLIACRVADPKLPKRAGPARVPKSTSTLTPAFASDTTKTRATLMLSASVYDRRITHLRWTHANVDYEAWSNIDWNFMRSVVDLQTSTTNYHVSQGIGDLSSAEGDIPKLPAFTPNRAEYFVFAEEGREPDNAAFAGIDALHLYYETNEQQLRIRYQRREALSAAQKRHAAAHPEKPKNAEIFFWKSETL